MTTIFKVLLFIFYPPFLIECIITYICIEKNRQNVIIFKRQYKIKDKTKENYTLNKKYYKIHIRKTGVKMIVNEQAVKDIIAEVGSEHLVAATKYVDVEEIEKLEKLGIRYFGENRVQAFLEKYEKYHGNGIWHFIGTLQSNKVKYIIDKVDLIHSVNTLKLIKEIEKQARKIDRNIDILLEVNIADEESKQGFDQKEIKEAIEMIQECPHVHVRGLMMMAPNIESQKTRIYFQQTKDLLENLKKDFDLKDFNILSMGMSQDYKIALEEGSTYVRIGRALFKN